VHWANRSSASRSAACRCGPNATSSSWAAAKCRRWIRWCWPATWAGRAPPPAAAPGRSFDFLAGAVDRVPARLRQPLDVLRRDRHGDVPFPRPGPRPGAPPAAPAGRAHQGAAVLRPAGARQRPAAAGRSSRARARRTRGFVERACCPDDRADLPRPRRQDRAPRAARRPAAGPPAGCAGMDRPRTCRTSCRMPSWPSAPACRNRTSAASSRKRWA
jgi:hypothetical protein